MPMKHSLSLDVFPLMCPAPRLFLLTPSFPFFLPSLDPLLAPCSRSRSRIITTYALTEELYQRKRKLKRRWMWRVTPFWVMWELIAWSLMLAAMVLLAWFVFYLSPRVPTATTYDVCDGDLSSPARFFMLRKDESGWSSYLANQLMVRG